MSSAQGVVVTNGAAPRDNTAVQYCLGYLSVLSARILSASGALSRSHSVHVIIDGMGITYSRVWINRVRLPILLVVS